MYVCVHVCEFTGCVLYVFVSPVGYQLYKNKDAVPKIVL